MNVRYERANAATSFEVAVPMELLLQNGESVAIRGLSADGLRLDSQIQVLPTRGTLRIPFQGYDVSVPVTFKKGKATDFLTFGTLESRSLQVIKLFHHGILTGEMAAFDKVISRLDTPVDLIPMEETEEEAKAAPPSRFKALLPAALYTLLAVVVFSTLAERLWTLVDTVPLTSARVVAPVDALMVAGNGYVGDVLVSPGDSVLAGQRLVAVANPEAAAAIEVTRSDVALAEKRVKRLQTDLKGFEAQRAREEVALLRALETGIAARRIPDFLGDYDLDDVRAAHAALLAFRETPWPQDYDQKRIHQDLKNRLEEEQANLRQLRRSLGRKKAVAASLDIKASADGVVSAVHAAPGQFVARGMPVADLERIELRKIEGIVSARRAAHLYLGMPARISLRTATGPRGFDATITGFATPGRDHFPDAEGVIVELTPSTIDIDTSRELFRTGAPVKAFASLNRLGWLTHWWRGDER